MGLTEWLAARLSDPRQGGKVRYPLMELLRQAVYAEALGYEAQDDQDRLAHDPAMKMAVWNRAGQGVLEERLASQPTHWRLLHILAYEEDNREVLREALAEWLHRYLRSKGRGRAVRYGTVDVDSFPLEVHGQQEGAAYNGHYGSTIYHPLVASFSVGGRYDSTRQGSRLGNGFVWAELRPGNVHTSQGAVAFIDRVIECTRDLAQVIDFRLDAGLTTGEVLDHLTERKIRFVGRLKSNAALERLAQPHLKRPVGRPPKEGYQRLVELGRYQARTWRHSQRVILVIVDRPNPVTGQLNLLPEYFFLVTSHPPTTRSAEQLLEHYRQRGTFEDRLGEFESAIGPHLSSSDALHNEATLLLRLLAFNLASLLRIELEDRSRGHWDLRRFQNCVLKAGGRVITSARRLVLYVARAVVPLWALLVRRIASWKLPPRWAPPRGARRRPWIPPPKHAHLQEVLRW